MDGVLGGCCEDWWGFVVIAVVSDLDLEDFGLEITTGYEHDLLISDSRHPESWRVNRFGVAP